MMVAEPAVLANRQRQRAAATRSAWQERIAFWLILLLFGGLSGWYSLATPPLKRPMKSITTPLSAI